MAGCVEDGMACLPATGAEAEDAASSGGVPVCMVCVRANSDNVKEGFSELLGQLTGDAEDVEKPYFRTVRKWCGGCTVRS